MSLGEQKIKFFLKKEYNIKPGEIEKIRCGVMNSNYIVEDSDKRRYIFRIYNFKTKEQVGFEVEVLEYLKDKDIPAPMLVSSINNEFILIFDDRPCVVYEYIEGESVEEASPELLRQIGEIQGRLHKILRDFIPSVGKPTWDPDELKSLAHANREKIISGRLPGAEELMNFVETELEKYDFPDSLPVGVTHQDMKMENILVKGGRVSGIVDFDNSYVGVLLHDVTTTVIWTCFTGGELNSKFLKEYLAGYNREREITEAEKECLLDSIKFRLVREVFIGPYVTPRYPKLSRERADYFINLYNNIKNVSEIVTDLYNKVQGVVLAAGMGRRLGLIAKDRPKPLLNINNKSLIEYTINFIKDVGVEDITVVGGYKVNKLEKKVKDIDKTIKLVNNPEYKYQNLLSLARALRITDRRDLLICNADYIFKSTTANAVSKSLNDISVYCSFDLSGDDDDVMKVKVDKNCNMIEMSKELTDFEAVYTGIFFFPAEHISELKDATVKLLKNNKKEATVEWLFKEFIDRGYSIKAVDIGRADWFEIDTEEDLERAKKSLDN